jgi:sugar lactone lactonase YvrE
LEYNSPINNGAAARRVFDQSGSFSGSACNSTSSDSLCNPVGAWLDGLGNLYIADSGENRILQYSDPVINGTIADRVFRQEDNFFASLCNLGASNRSADTLCKPWMATVDRGGNLYVADTSNNRVLAYDAPIPPRH